MDIKKVKKYIPKELKEKFDSYMLSQIMKGLKKFEREHDLDFVEKLVILCDSNEQDDESKSKIRKQIKAKLEQRIPIIKYEKARYEDIEQAIEYSKNTLNFIDSKENKQKVYYYELGKALTFIKQEYKYKKDFIDYMEERLNRKRRMIYKYIQFYNICEEVKDRYDLVSCNLSFKEICNNREIIIDV